MSISTYDEECNMVHCIEAELRKFCEYGKEVFLGLVSKKKKIF